MTHREELISEKQFDQMYSVITEHGWLTKEEARLLVGVANDTSGPMVEVGSYQGRSAMLLSQLKDKDGRYRLLYCIDPWDNHFHSELNGGEIHERFLTNICSLPHKGRTVVPLRKKVENWNLAPYLDTCQFVYLDGDHTYEGTLVQVSKALMCHPKIIAIHDVNDDGEGVWVKKAALHIFQREWDKRVGSLAVWYMEE